MKKEIKSAVLDILDENSGGMKMTHMVTSVIKYFGPQEDDRRLRRLFKLLELDAFEKILEEMVKDGKIRIFEYCWRGRSKEFIGLV